MFVLSTLYKEDHEKLKFNTYYETLISFEK